MLEILNNNEHLGSRYDSELRAENIIQQIEHSCSMTFTDEAAAEQYCREHIHPLFSQLPSDILFEITGTGVESPTIYVTESGGFDQELTIGVAQPHSYEDTPTEEDSPIPLYGYLKNGGARIEQDEPEEGAKVFRPVAMLVLDPRGSTPQEIDSRVSITINQDKVVRIDQNTQISPYRIKNLRKVEWEILNSDFPQAAQAIGSLLADVEEETFDQTSRRLRPLQTLGKLHEAAAILDNIFSTLPFTPEQAENLLSIVKYSLPLFGQNIRIDCSEPCYAERTTTENGKPLVVPGSFAPPFGKYIVGGLERICLLPASLDAENEVHHIPHFILTQVVWNSVIEVYVPIEKIRKLLH